MDTSRREESTEQSLPSETCRSHASRATSEQLREALQTETSPLAYWEAPNGLRMVGSGAVQIISGSTTAAMRDQSMSLLSDCLYDGPHIARPRILGARAFEDSRSTSHLWDGFPTTFGFLPRDLYVQNGEDIWYTVSTTNGSPASDTDVPQAAAREANPPAVIDIQPIPERSEWIRAVETVKDRINTGEMDKVVLAHSTKVTLDEPIVPLDVIDDLRSNNPGCYICFVRPAPDIAFIAATPEPLVSCRGEQIHSGALAGSIARGDTNDDDDRLSSTLRSDAKERYEHQLVVDAIATDLEAIGASVTIKDRDIRRFRSVQHLFTPVHATHPERPHILDVVDTLHPTPAVGGSPRDVAVSVINELEQFARGWYAAPIGWFDADGDGTFAVGIRSAVIRSTSARLFAGAGIVDESDPAAEWDEIQWKYRPILDTLDQS